MDKFLIEEKTQLRWDRNGSCSIGKYAENHFFQDKELLPICIYKEIECSEHHGPIRLEISFCIPKESEEQFNILSNKIINEIDGVGGELLDKLIKVLDK